jgi:hypothetical protein
MSTPCHLYNGLHEETIMKECKICGEVFEGSSQGWDSRKLNIHLMDTHQLSSEDYYRIYYNDHKCPYCNGNTEYLGIVEGFRRFCNPTCKIKWQYENTSLLEVMSAANTINAKRTAADQNNKFGKGCLPNRSKAQSELCKSLREDPTSLWGKAHDIPGMRDHFADLSRERLKDKSNNYGFAHRTVYNNIVMRSSWEAEFAKQCDILNIPWVYEPRTFKMFTNQKKYTPDFLLYDNIWVEIKPLCYHESFEKSVKAEFETLYLSTLHLLDLSSFDIFLLETKKVQRLSKAQSNLEASRVGVRNPEVRGMQLITA